MALANISKRDPPWLLLPKCHPARSSSVFVFAEDAAETVTPADARGEWSHRGISTPVSATLMPALGGVEQLRELTVPISDEVPGPAASILRGRSSGEVPAFAGPFPDDPLPNRT
jgi:hypothetical protein